ncbi:enoyl-CoA hydratase [Parahaliea mediterranea]|uniref:Enoyl-CoA hydratase n=1 Tax=Parahaliea mediterranea TaxID=651086 RepID=A0A939DIY3_9GAMM|nr:enoyl-CoA hydratase [Parahaliea mediterranea]MBN7798312.1 enoyl-CoA hydratase [Parahaliea mediterranea]
MTAEQAKDDQLVLVEISDQVALVTLNRPEAYNALSRAMTQAIIEAFARLSADDGVRAIVLTGRGKAFTAGVDLKEMGADGGSAMSADNLGTDAPLVRALAECEKPIIGAINGFAVTGGFELALACDYLYAARSARFADTHARVGLIPGWGLSQKLPRLVGINRAREISFTGNYFSAEQAHTWGLVNEVCEDDQLIERALASGRDIAGTQPEALRRIRAVMNDGWEMTLGDALQMEGERSGAYNSTIDFAAMEQRLAELKARGRRQ